MRGGNVLGFRLMFSRIFRFYVTGFREMTLGRTLWLLILVKLFVLFAVLRVFFFPGFLAEGREEEQVSAELIERAVP